ncbi:MAG: DUF4349 domain-containing protein [Nocardioidaceae bacterium]|nr:DUF4349 domain-containing protein [Nocardioidaceae bacterium]
MSTRRPATSAPTRATMALVAALLAVLTACTGAGGSADSDAAVDGTAASDLPQTGSVERSAAGATDSDQAFAAIGGTSPSALELTQAQLEQRDIIRTGSLSLVAKRPEDVRDRIGSLVAGLGGYVSDESAQARPEGGLSELRLVLRVPTGRFDQVIDDISALGRVRARSIQAEDVTTAVADVDSRVQSARAALERVRALLDRAVSLGSVIRLEGVLSNRQSDLESLLARQQVLAGQTSLATLEVEVVTPDEAPAPVEPDQTEGFVEGLRAGWDALAGAFVLASTAVGALLPFALLVALLGAPVWVWHRRRISPASGIRPASTTAE